MTQSEYLSQDNTDNALPYTDEQKAFDDMMMYLRRVVLMDEMNAKAINRAGKVGVAIRDLLGAVIHYERKRLNAKVVK